jgi:hypothetical protein
MHRRLRRAALAATLTIPLIAAGPITAGAATAPHPTEKPVTHSLKLADGSKVQWSDDGTGTLTDKQGRTRVFPVPRSAGRTGMRATLAPSNAAIKARADAARGSGYVLGAAGRSANAAAGAIQPMNIGPVPLPASAAGRVRKAAARAPKAGTADPGSGGVPTNAGLTTSLQSYLNAQGVDAVGAFHDTDAYLHALPGTGQIITNVSIGDLTDQSMAGDGYVDTYGPTTIVKNGQRYLDVPSMPLIPTYVADNDAHLDATGSTEGQDPTLGEVLLDFSMMAPLPHDRQRPEATGDGVTDLLGIAPGAGYRLVIPKEPSFEGINAALRAAAAQTPRPSVITASLGFGTDGSLGFPSRWLEDDPTIRATLADIVGSGIAVVVSSNDGTRLALPVSVGPDGGSTPTNLTTSASAQTDIDDVTPTTTPSLVKDTGVISAGSTTLDDTLASSDIRNGVYPTTRYDGSTAYSSGFGSRVDLATPGDNLPAFEHVCTKSPCGAQDVGVVLSGGTSASAPMIAAAVADVLQAAKATHQTLTPRQVRDLLVATARPVAQTPQTDQALHVGPQLDVTAAVEKVLSHGFAILSSAVRMSVAQRQLLPSTSATYFEEDTDPAAIDLAGPADANGNLSGQNAVSPITFGLDMTGDRAGITYRLQVGDKAVIPASGPSLRVLPAELLSAAGLPVTSDSSRSVDVSLQALRAGKVIASVSRRLTFTADDGTYDQAQAPDLPGSVPLGRPVTVHYDLTGVRGLDAPRLILSSVGHYTPNTGIDVFRSQWSTPLTDTKGTVTIPASAFDAGGAGIYGVGVEQSALYDFPIYGTFRAIRVGAGADERPAAPLLGTGGKASLHALDLTRSHGKLAVSWNTTSVPGADGAKIELLAPAPTLYGTINTTTNQNGSGPDANGVDHASTFVRALPSAKGRTTLDLSALKVPSGLQYPIRVQATRHGRPIGQSSPTSFVQYRDGDQLPGVIEGFTVSGGQALISTDEFGVTDGTDSLDRSATTSYSLANGTAGATITQSTAGDLMQLVAGTDQSTGHALILHRPFAGSTSAQIDVRDIKTGAAVKVTPIQSLSGGNGYLTGGAVDPVHHRGAVTTYDPDEGLTRLWPVDMASGTVGTPLAINTENTGRSFDGISIDASTGQVFVATTGTMGPCLLGRAAYGAVRADFDTGDVSPVSTVPLCTAGLLPDGKGGKIYTTVGSAQPSPYGGFPTSTYFTMKQSTLEPGSATTVGTRGPEWPAYDALHNVVVESSLYESGADQDNNPMSEITVLDPDTGQVLARHQTVNVVNSTIADSNFGFTSRQGMYLDPATRTGWVVNAWATGLERFTY